MTDSKKDDLVEFTSDIVARYVQNHTVDQKDLPFLINTVFSSLASIAEGKSLFPQTHQEPACSIEESITDDFLICLEDGKKLKMLKRYLRTHYNLSPEEYRQKWGLPRNYPMVAANYSSRRSTFAKNIGLGKNKKK